MKIVGWIVTIVGGIILSSIWRGYILSVLWGWFIVPIFHVTQISIALAIGLSIVVGMFMPSSSPESEEKKRPFGEAMLTAFLIAFASPLFALIIGAIIHAFV